MTEQDIFNMARKAGFGEAWFEKAEPGYPARPREGILIGFAKMLAAHEREECAKVCEELAALNRTNETDAMWEWEECAAAIRNRNRKCS